MRYTSGMSVWSSKRKSLILGIITLCIGVWFVVFVLPQFRVVPTCFDSIQNGKEEGMDCGGDCPQYCPALAEDLSIVWSRVFEVVPGRYNTVALVENQNTNAALASIAYEFRLYDDANVFVGRRTGTTYVLPNNKMAIFEAGIDAGDRIPVRSEFAFIQQPFWLQVPENFRQGIAVSTSNIVLKDPFESPRLSARISNTSRFDLYNVDVTAILYNDQNNVIAASQTFVEELKEGGSYDVLYTWQKPFSQDPVRIEILPQVDVFGVMQYR